MPLSNLYTYLCFPFFTGISSQAVEPKGPRPPVSQGHIGKSGGRISTGSVLIGLSQRQRLDVAETEQISWQECKVETVNLIVLKTRETLLDLVIIQQAVKHILL